jgi:nucleotide-binding universal stress UspA family protein
MFKKVMVAAGSSVWSKKAVEYASDLAKEFGAQLCIVHVVTSPSIISELLASTPFEGNLKKRGEEILGEASSLAKNRGTECKTLIKTGSVAENVVMAAIEEGVDLLVLGSRGEKGIVRGGLGSIASKVAATAPCPVLIVKDTSFLEEMLRKGILVRR